MTEQVSPELRALVAQVVREVVRDVTLNRSAGDPPRLISGTPTSAVVRRADAEPQPSGPANGAARSRIETIRITGNKDLQGFAFQLLELFENPKTREDLRAGRLTFELAGGVVAAAAPGAVERIEHGAVTERKVAAAAAAGTRLVLGQRAVLTPLAREKARTLGVPVEKERR